MGRRFLIVVSVLFSAFTLHAQNQDSLVFDNPVEAIMSADTTEAGDTLQMSDEEIMKMLASPQAADTVKKVVDRGFDVSRMVNARRQRATDFTPFTNKPFLANTFVSAGLKTTKIMTEDYSFGLMGSLSFGKWLHEDHAVRMNFNVGTWRDNLDATLITGVEVNASYLFNLTSYVGGYRTNRFCEILIVAGPGYASSLRNGKMSHAVSGHVGANLKLRLFKDIDFFVEPLGTIYSNGMAVSYAGNWRSWLSTFQTTCGLTYNIRQSKSPDSPALLPRPDGWFIFVSGGPHFQNSRLVYQTVGLGKSLGVHMNLGLGKYYTDWFAMRYSAAFSRGSWVIYGDDEYPCNYFAARAEGAIDLIDLLRKDDKNSKFSASLLVGPEIGYMYKVDQDSDNPEHVPVIKSAYLGLTGGIQAKMYLGKRFAIALEPRFTLLPYDAPAHDESTNNKFRNYYDGVFNFNFGIEYML